MLNKKYVIYFHYQVDLSLFHNRDRYCKSIQQLLIDSLII